MADVVLEQVVFHRDHEQAPRLLGRSRGLGDDSIELLTEIVVGFGDRPPGVACPHAVFAQPLGRDRVVVVQVRDVEPGADGWAGLRYHGLVLSRADYEGFGSDPFALAQRFPASPLATDLAPLTCPAEPINSRNVARVRSVLRRVKAHALPEGADPEHLPPLTVENAESPMLLGGAQILVDGGKLLFERPRPDASLLEALWTLLPHSVRPGLWPATFAFGNQLGFDVLVVPDARRVDRTGYTTEEQAGDYPAGSYELALQTAAESGDEHELARVLARRSSHETLQLGLRVLVGVTLLVLVFRWVTPGPRTDTTARAATAAGIVGVGNPWTAAAMLEAGDRLFRRP